MGDEKKFNIHLLSQSERILLAEELWDSIAENQDNLDLELTDYQRKLLESRLKSYYDSPDDSKSWEEVKNEMK